MARRNLPSVDKVLSHPTVQGLVGHLSHEGVVYLVRQELDLARHSVGEGDGAPSLEELAQRVVARGVQLGQQHPRPVINATGVIIHTNLGRAPLSADALAALQAVARGYSDLEMELEEGRRGSRQAHVDALLCQLTGAEAALVVNNNASAVLLGLMAVAQGREVIVSRGEAVEIGGGFRIPDVLRQSGSVLVEVGTTNRTYVEDYQRAITSSTGALLKVHASNFRVTGFVHSPFLEELVALGRQHGLPVLHDLGSGCLMETARFGLGREPMPQESIAAGVDLAFFSGDKLLGGPQAGIVVGKVEWVGRLARHPLARAVRIDKLSLAALRATLLHYVKGEVVQKVPVWAMISRPARELQRRARRWQRALGPRAGVSRGWSTVGGGSLPGEVLETWLVTLRADDLPGGAGGFLRQLREGTPPIIGRIEEEQVVLDPRTVLPEEEQALLEGIKDILQQAP